MGANFSALFFGQEGSNACSNGSNLALQSKPNLGDLPEDCVALILGYFDPPEICKLASMNRAFRGASWADFVWESKLPSNYEVLLQKVFDDVPENLGKRQIYERLCRANSFDGGTKVFLSLSLCVRVFFFSVWVLRKCVKIKSFEFLDMVFDWL